MMVDRLSLGARWVFCCLSVALSAVFNGYAPLRALDDRLQDFYTASGRHQPVPPGVVIVDISESSLASLGPWPWPRTTLAELSQALRARGAKLQVWDLLLPEPAPGDEALAASLSQPDVVLGQVLVTDPHVAQPPAVGLLLPAGDNLSGLCSATPSVTGYLGVSPSLHANRAGHIGATPDADGRLRSLPAVICHQGQAFPQLALAAAQAAQPGTAWRHEFGFWPWDASQTLTLGPWRFPLDEKGWLRVPYARSHHDWPAVSIERVLDPSIRLPEIQGSIVLIGSTALGLADIVNTPFYPVAPGVSVHAELVSGALLIPDLTASPQPAYFASNWIIEPRGSTFLTAMLTAALGLLLVMRLWPQAALKGSVTVSLGALSLPFLLAPIARELGILMPVLPVAAALALQAGASWLFNAAWLQHHARVMARHLRGFMPPALASQIATHNPTGDSLGQLEQGTVMAIRIDGLQRWQESVEPLRALAVIHALHASAQSVCSSFGGRLEQLQGDLLMVAWPDPHSGGAQGGNPELAAHAAERTLQELQPLLRLNESDSHPLSMNIAIESGLYLHGLVGHADSRSALLLGPAVTDAQSILGFSGELACQLLIGPKAAARMGQEGGHVERMGRFVLPFQAEPKDLFRLQTPYRFDLNAARG